MHLFVAIGVCKTDSRVIEEAITSYLEDNIKLSHTVTKWCLAGPAHRSLRSNEVHRHLSLPQVLYTVMPFLGSVDTQKLLECIP